jgi:ADP-ribose pyrophosphatase YjhB (NUDIX family)
MTKNIYCTNCGKYGHMIKTCYEPIASFGIILYHKNNDKIKYLLIRRKDSHNYVEFMIGRYNINDKDFLNTMFSEMTIDERNNILTKNFNDLWNDLWGDQTRKKNRRSYNESFNKYFALKNGHVLNNELITIDSLINSNVCVHTEPEWGFPKGKRNYKEKNLQVALREFSEETYISLNDVVLDPNVDPISEIFIGSNNKKYKHVYYVAYTNELLDVHVDKNNTEQIKEVGDIGWYSLDEANHLFRESDIEKKNVLFKINEIVKS